MSAHGISDPAREPAPCVTIGRLGDTVQPMLGIQKGGWVRGFGGGNILGALLLWPVATGCVSSAQVESEQLPVRRVVIYRNGVAYFERKGEVDSEEVHFKLREENVGDFLATLAVLERGGHTVRAASFPVKMEKDGDEPIDPALAAALDRWDRKNSDKRKLRRVTLELDGEKHDISVGYLAETPLWRPSYRLVVGEKGTAVFQAWGIVQNQSGEDWKDVEIALVAGAPIAFQSTLGEPIVPRRPVVSDQGEVIMAVPEGQTTLRIDEAPPAPPREMYAEESMAADGGDASMPQSAPAPSKKSMGAGRASGSIGQDFLARGEADAGSQDDFAPTPQDPSRLARVEIQSGATRYEVPHRVTIPDQSATMVLFVNKKVKGEAVFLYSPDGGVPDSSRHPFRVARFKNESGGMLERGPIAVFEKGAFLGQGVVDALPADAEATVPFALMRSVTIDKESSYDQRGARLYSVQQGLLTIERDQATLTEYKVRNGDPERAHVLIRHHRIHGAKLWNPPKGTEELSAESSALIPMDVLGHGKASLLVEERIPIKREVDWLSAEARSAVREYLKDPGVPPVHRTVLEDILKHAAQLATLDDQERRLTREQRELEKSTRETRLSLEAIEKNQQAAALRRELTTRLAEGTKRLDEITKELVEVHLRRTEQEVRLKEARQGLVIEPSDRGTGVKK